MQFNTLLGKPVLLEKTLLAFTINGKAAFCLAVNSQCASAVLLGCGTVQAILALQCSKKGTYDFCHSVSFLTCFILCLCRHTARMQLLAILYTTNRESITYCCTAALGKFQVSNPWAATSFMYA